MRDNVRGGQQREVVQRVVPRGAAGHQALRPRQAQVRQDGPQKGDNSIQLETHLVNILLSKNRKFVLSFFLWIFI